MTIYNQICTKLIEVEDDKDKDTDIYYLYLQGTEDWKKCIMDTEATDDAFSWNFWKMKQVTELQDGLTDVRWYEVGENITINPMHIIFYVTIKAKIVSNEELNGLLHR